MLTYDRFSVALTFLTVAVRNDVMALQDTVWMTVSVTVINNL